MTYGDGTATSAMTYSYNLSGALIEQQYPSGQKVKNTIDSNGDLSMVQSRKNSTSGYWSYANSFSYDAAGAVTSMQLGNGRWESTTFNERLQPMQIALGTTSGAANLLDLDYTYGTTNNNGNVLTQTITVPTVGVSAGFTAVQTYNYDPVNRLKDATENITPHGGSQTQSWKQAFLYDRFGNKNFDAPNTTVQSTGSSTAKVTNPEIVPANNRFKEDQDADSQSDYLHDASGNLTKNARGQNFSFNAENLQTSATASGLSVGYSYDGNDKRVKAYDSINDETTIFVYDANGRLVEEYSTATPPTNPTTNYLTEDALGSVRIATNSYGDVGARRDFLPFGEELYAGLAGRNASQKYSSATDEIRKKFATYQRDSETGLDFAQSRYYSSMHGRFNSPDEFKGGPDELFDFEEDASDNPTFYAELENPQSLNKYQYAYNNPYKYNDPTGHCPPQLAIPCRIAQSPSAGRIWDGIRTSSVVVVVSGAVGTAVSTVIDSVRNSAQAGVGDASCPACVASQRMAQSYMNERAPEVRARNSDSNQAGNDNKTDTKAQNIAKADKKRIPRNQLGPSGKPKVHVVRHATKKRAKDAARNQGQGAPDKDNNPTKGGSHFHSTSKDGTRKKGKDNVHHEFKLKGGKLQ